MLVIAFLPPSDYLLLVTLPTLPLPALFPHVALAFGYDGGILVAALPAVVTAVTPVCHLVCCCGLLIYVTLPLRFVDLLLFVVTVLRVCWLLPPAVYGYYPHTLLPHTFPFIDCAVLLPPVTRFCYYDSLFVGSLFITLPLFTLVVAFTFCITVG